MSQCIANKTYSRERCRNEAVEGRQQCAVHEAMPSEHEVVGRLKKEAHQVGHLVISADQYRTLLNDRDRLRQLKEKVARDERTVGWGSAAGRVDPTKQRGV